MRSPIGVRVCNRTIFGKSYDCHVSKCITGLKLSRRKFYYKVELQKRMDKFIAAVILVVCMSVDISSGKTPFHTCKSGSSKVTNVVIPGCNAPPCKLKKGSSAAMSISFTAGEGYTKVTADVHGVISYIPVPFTPPNVDGCQHSGLTCPLTKGKNYVYNNTIPIKSSYPNLQLVVRWELLDENNKDILCIEIPAEISD